MPDNKGMYSLYHYLSYMYYTVYITVTMNLYILSDKLTCSLTAAYLGFSVRGDLRVVGGGTDFDLSTFLWTCQF